MQYRYVRRFFNDLLVSCSVMHWYRLLYRYTLLTQAENPPPDRWLRRKFPFFSSMVSYVKLYGVHYVISIQLRQ